MSTHRRKADKEDATKDTEKGEAPPPAAAAEQEETTKPAAAELESSDSDKKVNVRLGTLSEVTDDAAAPALDRYIYCDFSKINEDQRFDNNNNNVDYELDSTDNDAGLMHALDEATGMAAAQSSQMEAEFAIGGSSGGGPYSSMNTLTQGNIIRASGWIRSQRFPVKLYALLAQPALAHIITWMPHGRSWKVLKPKLFETSILPVFFESDNYHSFNRVVNAWSFRRKSAGADRGSYFHELFLRGKPHLQKHMRRLPRTHKKLAMSKQEEPDFFDLDRSSPLPTMAESRYALEARKMKRLQDRFENGTLERNVIPKTEGYAEAALGGRSGVARQFLAFPGAAGTKEAELGKAPGAGENPLSQAYLLEQERYRQAAYQSQMGGMMIPGVPIMGQGMAPPMYGAMNPMGPMNPYFQGPPPPL
ncbi:MAG: hypothetical protein SGARI_003030 [Bacillariaceae sp.]